MRIRKSVPYKATHLGEVVRDELFFRGINHKEFMRTSKIKQSHLRAFLYSKGLLSYRELIFLSWELDIGVSVLKNIQFNYVLDVLRIKIKKIFRK